MDINDFYSELLIEYSNDKSYCKVIDNPSFEYEFANPLCGDEVRLIASIQNGLIQDVAYQGQGCAISQASAAILCSLVKGQSLDVAQNLISDFEKMIIEKHDPTEGLGDAKILSGVSKLPSRHRCALLAWEGLKKGIAKN